MGTEALKFSGEPLSAVEQTALDFLIQAASAGRQVTQREINIAVGSSNIGGGTASGILNRLQRKGAIRRKYYQRGVQVCIVSTGKCTAEPRTTAPHWREIASRSENVTPVMAIHQLREEVPSIMGYIQRMMQDRDITYTAASIELLSRGISHREAENAR